MEKGLTSTEFDQKTAGPTTSGHYGCNGMKLERSSFLEGVNLWVISASSTGCLSLCEKAKDCPI